MPIPSVSSTPAPTPPSTPPSTPSSDGSTSSTPSTSTGSASPTSAGESGSTPGGATPDGSESAFEGGLSQKKRKAAERALGRAGLFSGNVDGTLTPTTRKAVRAFQKAHGLQRTGHLDKPTYRRLMKLSRAIQKQGKATGRVGMKSGRIRNIEKRLRKLGYDPGKVDGLFTKKTADAVTHFKKDQGMDNTAGSIAQRAQKALRKEDVAVSHVPHRVRVQDTKARKRADAHVTQLAQRVHGDGTRGLGRGAKAKGAVKTVQRHLRAAGYDPKHTSGNFDDRTEGMVKQFQKKSGLPATGRVNAATWKKLRRATLEATGPASPQQRKGERSAAVKKTERLLKKLGFHPGKVDGFYDAKTQKAVDRFRKAYDVAGKGGVGSHTLKKLKRADALGKGQKVTGYVQGVPRTISVVDVDGVQMEKSTAKAWLKMKKAAAKDGISLQVNSGFRSMAKQQFLYNGYIQGKPGFNLAAVPGYSNHQSGAALDIQVGLGSSAAVGSGATYSWLANHASQFGFQRIASEAWHWEFQPLLRKYGL